MNFTWPETVPESSQINREFIQGMLNRMATSFFKYGPAKGSKSHGLKNAKERIKIYEKTGNTEGLVDAANFLMIEFMNPGHKNSHFRATGSHESPGRILVNGMRTHGKV